MITKREASIAMRHARQKPLRPWQRASALLLAISVAACGTAPQQVHPRTPQESGTADTPYRIPPGSRIAVAMASFDPPSADVDTSESAVSSPSGGNGLSELGKNVGIYTLGGAARVGAYAILCGPAILICLPFLAAVGGIGGAVVGLAETAYSAISRSGIDTAGIDTAGNHVPSIDAETESVDLEAAKVLSARPLTDRIQDYARERGLEVGPVVSDPSLASPSEPSRYHGRADYVVEIAGPRGVRQRLAGGNSWWRFDFNAWGRLVRVSDGVVVDTFLTSNVTDISRYGTGVHEQRVSAEIDAAIQTLAVAIVDEWIAPAAPELRAIVIFDSSGEIGPNSGQRRQASKESGPPDTNRATEQDANPKTASDDDEPRLPQSTASAASPATPQRLAAMSPTPTPAPAKPVAAEVGGLRQGDRWEYAFVDSRNGRPTSRRFEIEQVDRGSIVERVELEDGKRLTASHHRGAYLSMVGGMQLAPYYFAFQPDAATSPIGEVKAEGGDACASRPDVGYSYQLTYDCEIRADFLGIESVTVPAGTFPAHAVRITVDAQAWGGHNAHRFNLINARFWISAKAGRIVKAVITHEADPPWTETMELVSYRTGDRMTGSRPTAVSR